MSKHVLRTLGLSLMMALGLMAFAVVGAEGANLKISEHVRGEIKVLNSSALKAEVGGVNEGAVGLLVPNLGVEITCVKFTVIEGFLNNTAAKGHGIATVLFEECKVYEIKKTLPFDLIKELPCLPLDSVSGKDGHIRATALALVVLHESKDYLIFEALEGNPAVPIATVKYTPETGCPIPLKQEVFGQYGFEINTGDKHTSLEVSEPLITAGNHKILQTLLGLVLKYGLNEAFLDGTARLKLLGTHAGCVWGFL